MKTKIKTLNTGLALSCALFAMTATSAIAGAKLDAVNAAVEAKAAQIDKTHGVLLDTNERNELKMDLITQQVVTDTADDTSKSVSQKAADANVVYEITDTTEQRKLLIKLEAQVQQKGTGGGGTIPDYP